MSSIEQPPSGFESLANVPVMPDPVYQARYPIIWATEGYLNDPIQFDPNEAFIQYQIPQQSDTGPFGVQRDIAQFLIVKINDPIDEKFSVLSFAPLYDRTKVSKIFDMEFRELV